MSLRTSGVSVSSILEVYVNDIPAGRRILGDQLINDSTAACAADAFRDSFSHYQRSHLVYS